MTKEIEQDILAHLFSTFSKFTLGIKGLTQNRGATDTFSDLGLIQEKCTSLFEEDYHISVLNNRDGEYCNTYPPEIILLQGEKNKNKDVSATLAVNNTSLEQHIKKGKFARVRSSTLSNKMESVIQTYSQTIKSYGWSQYFDAPSPQLDDLRSSDIEIIKSFKVKYILDLMVENKKTMFGYINVCSSEKVDLLSRYDCFNINSIPYPGVEFFSNFSKNQHNAKDLHFNWGESADASLCVDEKFQIGQNNDIKWDQYKSWDLISMSQNYISLMLCILCEKSDTHNIEDPGLLIHCVSGWDRTPLFISLLRISLWADNAIHKSLSAQQILYLTVGYDWLLFSHQLSERSYHGQDIFYFCFYFLSYIVDAKFSVHNFQNDKNLSIVHSPPLSRKNSELDFNLNDDYFGGSDTKYSSYDALDLATDEDFLSEEIDFHPLNMAKKNGFSESFDDSDIVYKPSATNAIDMPPRCSSCSDADELGSWQFVGDLADRAANEDFSPPFLLENSWVGFGNLQTENEKQTFQNKRRKRSSTNSSYSETSDSESCESKLKSKPKKTIFEKERKKRLKALQKCFYSHYESCVTDATNLERSNSPSLWKTVFS